MRILIDIGHPAHVHFYKNAIINWQKRGHEILVIARIKDVVRYLLDAYDIEYKIIGKTKHNIVEKGIDMLIKNSKIYKVSKDFRPDILTGIFSPYISQVGSVLRKPSIIFTDTELVQFNWLVIPFATAICTPKCFKRDFGKKQIKYNGYHELAYLHPKYFEPDKSVIEELDVHNERYIIIRLISWSAYHDVNLRGLEANRLIDIIKLLENYGRVFISSERNLNGNLRKYELRLPPDKIHSVLYYSDLYLGEGGTMAAEAAILGTPSIHIESTKSGKPTGETSGNFLELRDKYKLLYFFSDSNEALNKAIEILENKKSKRKWRKKRERLLKEKIDVTKWVTDFIERYSESFYRYKKRRRNN